MFESWEDMNMSAALLRPVVCVSDIMSKSGICCEGVKYAMNQPFLFSIGVE